MGHPMACSCSRHSGSSVRRDGLEREDSYKSDFSKDLTESLKRAVEDPGPPGGRPSTRSAVASPALCFRRWTVGAVLLGMIPGPDQGARSRWKQPGFPS